MVYIVTCIVVLPVTSCTSQNRNGKDVQILMRDSAVVTVPQRMQVSDTKTTITYRGKEYHSLVARHPDKSLPVARNEQGERFVDNSTTLRIACSGKQVVGKVLMKESSASLVDAKFMKYAILEELVYNKATPQGVVYATSICHPQTNLCVPLRLTVPADGKISMAKGELLEDVYEEENNSD